MHNSYVACGAAIALECGHVEISVRVCRKFVLAAVTLTGCDARVGSDVHVPEDAQSTCRTHCLEIGMELSAVAIMLNNVNCICQVRSAAPGLGSTEAVTSGMATIMLQEEEQRRQQQRQQQAAR